MRPFRSSLALLGSTLLGLASSASAELILVPQAAVTLSGYEDTAGAEFTRRVGLGVGAKVIWAQAPSTWTWELGALLYDRRFTESYLGRVARIGATTLQIPLLLRWAPVEFLSIGAGLQYSRILGPLSREVDGKRFTVDPVSEEAPWRYHRSELGVLAAIGGHFPLVAGLRLSVDVRFIPGSSWPGFYDTSDFQLLTGVEIPVARGSE